MHRNRRAAILGLIRERDEIVYWNKGGGEWRKKENELWVATLVRQASAAVLAREINSCSARRRREMGTGRRSSTSWGVVVAVSGQ